MTPAAARNGPDRRDFYGVGALPFLALGGCDRQTHFLTHGAGQEPANRMRLPAGRFRQFLQRDTVGPLQEVEHLGGFAAVTRDARLFYGLGRFLGCFGLGDPLGRNVRVLWANTSLLAGFRLLGGSRLGCARFFGSQCDHSGFSYGGGFRNHIHHSGAPKMQVKSERNWMRRWENAGAETGCRMGLGEGQ